MAKIAVMDDSRLMRTLMQSFLVTGGHEVEVWEPMSAAEVAEKVSAYQPDLLITDFQMPGANGATVTKMARRANPDLPVLVVTSLRDPETMALLERHQVSGIIHKPVNGDMVLAAVSKALSPKS